MNIFEIIRAVIFTLPLGIFSTIGLFVIVAILMKVQQIDILLKRIIPFYSLSAAISSLLLLFYYYVPDIFAEFDILYCAAVVFSTTLFYHLLCFAIQIKKNFKSIHYIIPALLFTCMLGFKLIMPEIWAEDGIQISLTVALFFSIAYALLSIFRMNQYYIKLALNHKESLIDIKIAIHYLGEIVIFPLVFIIIPLISGPQITVLPSLLLMICIILALIMNIPLVYKIIRHYTSSVGNTPLFAPSIVDHRTGPPPSHIEEKNITKKRFPKKYTKQNDRRGTLIKIDKKAFEQYFRKHKPFRKHKLTIIELAEMLNTNRTYLSHFINSVYGMNFNSYINFCRLCEMERLLTLPANKGKSVSDLIDQTGFLTLRNYVRGKKQFTVKNNKAEKENTENVMVKSIKKQ